jgi:thiamine kinase
VNQLLSPEDALSRVPGFKEHVDLRNITPIAGGLTNRSFLVDSGSEQLVLRLDAEQTTAIGLDRHTELRILRNAAEASLAPQVRYAEPEAGILLYEYLPGPVWNRASLDDDDNLDRAASLLRNVHALPASGVVLDPLAAASRYAAVAARNTGLRAHTARWVDIVRAAPEPAAGCCCHNDVIASNIIGDIGDHSLKLLDWEYACDNDPWFDVASLIAYHDLDRRQSDSLLQAYTGGPASGVRERLESQLRLYDAIQALWLAARYVIAPNSEHRARLEQLRRRIR